MNRLLNLPEKGPEFSFFYQKLLTKFWSPKSRFFTQIYYFGPEMWIFTDISIFDLRHLDVRHLDLRHLIFDLRHLSNCYHIIYKIYHAVTFGHYVT